jgi:hypothetical protein
VESGLGRYVMEMDDDIRAALDDGGVSGNAGRAVRGDGHHPSYTLYDLIVVGLYRSYRDDSAGLEYLIALGEKNGARH